MSSIFSFNAQMMIAASLQKVSSARPSSIENGRHCVITLSLTMLGECERNAGHRSPYELNLSVKYKNKNDKFSEHIVQRSYLGADPQKFRVAQEFASSKASSAWPWWGKVKDFESLTHERKQGLKTKSKDMEFEFLFVPSQNWQNSDFVSADSPAGCRRILRSHGWKGYVAITHRFNDYRIHSI